MVELLMGLGPEIGGLQKIWKTRSSHEAIELMFYYWVFYLKPSIVSVTLLSYKFLSKKTDKLVPGPHLDCFKIYFRKSTFSNACQV